MTFLLGGNHGILRTLSEQVAGAAVTKRDLTGVGFFTYFEVAPSVHRLHHPGRLIIDDVHASLADLEYPLGFLLFVENGVIDVLEGFAYGDEWPANASDARLYYVRPVPPPAVGVISVLEETTERSLHWADPRRGSQL